MKKATLTLVTLIFFTIANLFSQPLDTYHQRGELPTTTNELFSGSGNCVLCHNSMVNDQGQSVAIVNDWRSTMMANSAKDPLWRAKVSHEGLVNPAHKEVLEDVCTSCHAAAGNKNAHHQGMSLYTISDLENDPLGLDGVQCTVCHQITDESMGNYSGTFEIGTSKTIWGPFTNPFANPMINETGYTPVYGGQINNSLLCASCHTLITNSVDNDGNPTGNTFVEQSVYQEWLNSNLPDENTTCQTCHVPRIDDVVKISSMPPWLDGRSPFGMHQFAGANVFMAGILKDNIETLNLAANESQFDSTIVRNLRMLQNNSVETELTSVYRTEELLKVDLHITNIAGHKIPTGFPSRRIFVELIAISETGDTIFHSGEFNSDGDLLDESADFEVHYNTISNENEVQIYEIVMGDFNYEVTTVLERANYTLKDNRIPPVGFTTTHLVYDTVKIVGEATNDEDFNKENNVEGSGSDIIHYNIPTYGYTGDIEIIANIYYQTVNPKWLSEMFSYSSDEIDLFKDLFTNADKHPVLMSENVLTSIFTGIDVPKESLVNIYPNPSLGDIYITGSSVIDVIWIYDISGNLVEEHQNFNTNKRLTLPEEKGIYLIKLTFNNNLYTKKVVVK